MADQRISQLTKLAQGDVAANDVLAIVDVGASTTKKVEAKDLFQAGANLADSASIDLVKLNQSSTTKLGTTALADDAVTAAKLADDSSIAYDSVAPSTNNFEGRGYVNSTTKYLQVWNGSSFDQVVAPTAGIGDLQVTTGKLADNAVTTAKVDAAGLAAAALATDSVITAKIQDLAVTTGKLAALSVTTAKIAADAVTADELASNAVVTASIVDANVTEAKLATGAVTEAKIATGAVTVGKIADTQITYAKLNLADASVPGAKLVANSVTSSQMALDSVTTGALTDLNVTTGKLADSAVTNAKLANGAITTAKIDAAGLGEAAIATNAVTTGKVLDGAITAAKLAADSTTIVQAGTPVGSGAYEGQLWFDTNTSVQYVWNGTAWIRQAALNVINFSDTTPLNFAVAYPDTHTANITTTLDTQQANTVFSGPTTGADAAPTFRALLPADLPDATSTSKGIIEPGTGLAVNAGVLNHANSVTPGTYTRVAVDAEGHVSQGDLLEASDIPDLDAAKITTGELPTDRLADAAVTIDKLADYSTASLGDTLPLATFIGQIHLNSLDRSFFMWDGNVWVPIGISAGQIIFAGTFDASDPAGTGKIASLTPEGLAAGFTLGALPASSATNNKHYFVVSEGGTITGGNAPNVALAPPDIILSVWNTSSAAWVEVDVSSGAGAIAASQVSFTPVGDIAATNVQTALAEVSSECRNASNITSGTLAVARGGTNLASYTKGDIIAASAGTTLVKLPVGTNGQVLTADSTEASGLKYTTPTVGTVTGVTSATTALTVATSTTTPALTIRSATTSVDGIVQLSDSTGTTSSVLAATPTAVKSAYDLAALALPAAGGTVTGELLIGSAGTLVFEGSTSDGNETTLAVADPTADRTITLPNVTGTVVTTGDSGTVTSTMIADGTIVNADINASAAIAGTKISPDFGSQTVATTGVFSHALGAAATPSVTFTGDLNTGVFSPGADQVAISTNGVQRINIEADGDINIDSGGVFYDATNNRLAIGTTAPTEALTIAAGATDRVGASVSGTVATIFLGNSNNATSCSSISYDRADGGLTFNNGSTGSITERARIDSSGRLLVGTSSARANFFNATATTQLQIEKAGGGGGVSVVSDSVGDDPAILILAKSNNASLGGNTVVAADNFLGTVAFHGNDGTEFVDAARISCYVDGTPGTNDMPGRLVFSTTADGASSPTERMTIYSYGRVNVGHSGGSGGIQCSDGSVYSLLLRDRISFNASPFYIVNENTVGVYLSNGGTSWAAQSDERIKTDLTEIENGLSKVGTLRAVTGRYKTDDTETRRSFLIAQDVQVVLPEAVDVAEDEQGTLGLRYSEVIPLLVAALKESKQRIETLEAKVAALEAS